MKITCFSSHSGTSGQTSWLGDPNSSRDGRMKSLAPLGPGQPGRFGASPTGRQRSRRCKAASSHCALDTNAPRAFCQSETWQQPNYDTENRLVGLYPGQPRCEPVPELSETLTQYTTFIVLKFLTSTHSQPSNPGLPLGLMLGRTRGHNFKKTWRTRGQKSTLPL